MIAPGFGGYEALDQAQKAMIAVNQAEAALSWLNSHGTTSDALKSAVENARSAATAAQLAADAAFAAEKKKNQNRGDYLRLDFSAAEAAVRAKAMRKVIEYLLGDSDPSLK